MTSDVTQPGLLDPKEGDRVRVVQGKDQGKTGVVVGFTPEGKAIVQSNSTGNRKTFPLIWLQADFFSGTSDTASDSYSDPLSDLSPDLDDRQDADDEGLSGVLVSEAVSSITTPKLAKKRPSKSWQTVYRYRSKGQMYYRYAWKDENGRGLLHIAGGNWRSRLVQERKNQVKAWIAEGQAIPWIAEQVSRWGF